MSRENAKNAVIEFLQQNNYQYVRSLGEGTYGFVIAVITPEKEVVAIKIIEKEYIGIIEDQAWPTLSHRNILPLMDVMKLENPSLNLYVTPMMPKCLFSFVPSEQFKNDPNSFMKIRLWLYDVLLALDYLHSNLLCHCDLKSDNVLLDEDDRAILCDFSGLNYTGKPLQSICSPLIFRPPECFNPEKVSNVQGVPLDMYTFGLTALNLLTGHWPQIKLMEIKEENLSWYKSILPILEETMNKVHLKYLMKRAFPKATLSERDIEQAKDFLQRLMNSEPAQRLTAQSAMKHPFLQMGGNPFRSAENDLKITDDQHISAIEEKNIHLEDEKIKYFPSETGARPKDSLKFSTGDNAYINTINTTNNLRVEEYERIKENQDQFPEQEKIHVFLPKSRTKPHKATNRNFERLTTQHFVQQEDVVQCPSTNCLIFNNVCDGDVKKTKNYIPKRNIRKRVTDWIRKKIGIAKNQ